MNNLNPEITEDVLSIEERIEADEILTSLFGLLYKTAKKHAPELLRNESEENNE